MKKKEQGILTIEASLVLTLFLFFVLFLFSFARIYRAQNMISHATMQSADALALESFIREAAHVEDAEKIVKLGSQLSGLTSLSAESFTSLRAAEVPKLAKDKFVFAISSSESNADAVLKKLGVKGGLSGVDFSSSKVDLESNDVIVYVNYTLELQFPVFGFNEINVTKAAKAKTFGNILFEICTLSNDDRKGTASGGGSYIYGSTIEITAEPKYGYYFDGWDDDGDGIVDYDVGDPITTSKRTVTVTDSKTYTAIFKNNGYGINAYVEPAGIENITIAPSPNAKGLHMYGSKVELTVSNNHPHYIFTGWTGQLLQDKDGDGFEETVSPISSTGNNLKYVIPEVQGNYHLTAKFTPKQYKVSVKVKDNVGGSAVIEGINRTDTTVTYPASVSLTARPIDGYAIDYWMKDNTIIQSSYGQSTLLNEQITGDVEYTVVFKNIKVTVIFVGPNNENLDSFVLNKGENFREADLNVPSYTVIGGRIFDGWIEFNSNLPINEDKTVKGNWSLPSIQINSGASTNTNTTTLSVTKYPSSGTVTWSSADISKATVNSNGTVTAVGEGKVDITATLKYHGLECSDSVTVEIGVDKIKLEEYNYKKSSNGDRHYFDSEVMPGSRLPGYCEDIGYGGHRCSGALTGSRKYGDISYSQSYFYYRYIWVTEAELDEAKRNSATNVAPGGNSSKSYNQWGYNKTGKTGYIFNPYADQKGFIFFETNEKTYKITSIS